MKLHNSKSGIRGSTGFSLIEVMIAVLVLATGLLAMAALQATLVRNSADAKARSQVVAFIDRVFDAQRAIDFDTIPVGSNLQTVVSTADIAALQNATGVSGVTVRVDSARMVGGIRSATTFDDFSTFTTAEQALVRSFSPEYRRMDIRVGWTDATGGTRSMSMRTIISPISLDQGTLLTTKPNDGGGSIAPVVRTDNPAGEGVIPIAVGDNRDTAATNPKPILDSRGVRLSTRFNVLTYENENTDARIQRRVETEVVSCVCRYGNPPSDAEVSPVFKVVVRPTFWNGLAYAEPDEVEGDNGTGDTIPPSWTALDRRGNPVTPQSPLCNDCCRDHHDVTGVDVEFDPFRTDAHDHFYDDFSEAVDPSATGDRALYRESCRFIRVDGRQRVAADLNLEHQNILKTRRRASTAAEQTDFVPEQLASDNYADFVVAYLDGRILPIGQDNTVDAAALETTYNINDPAELRLTTATSDIRFLHHRGLYLDFLEPPAIAALRRQLASCASPNIECLLANVPFLTINTTELGRWQAVLQSTDDLSNKLSITNGSGTSIELGGTVPNRGQANPTANATGGSVVRAKVALAKSNTGLTASPALDSGDSTGQTSDYQVIRFTGTGDTDGDGVLDAVDNCLDDANPDQLNSDADNIGQPGDVLGDVCDRDDDNDGLVDTGDSCPVKDDLGSDFDGDNVDDACDPPPDTDGDGIPDFSDSCPAVRNIGTDYDSDGVDDACDPPPGDRDGDGIPDATDSCPDNRDLGTDFDRDGIDDACDPPPPVDTDGDGIPDASDSCPNVRNLGTDFDRDGIDDACDPAPPSPTVDFDVNIDISGLSGYDNSSGNLVRVDHTNVSRTTNCNGDYTPPQPSDPNPYQCNGANSTNTSLVLSNYNRAGTTRITNPCRTGNADATVCFNYRIVSVTNGTVGAATNDGRLTETTTVTLGTLTANQVLTVTLGTGSPASTTVAGTCSGTTYIPGACN